MEVKFRTLRADEIDVRVAQITDKGCALLLYKNARVDMDLLDETVGAMNWQREHSRNNANCTVSIYDDFRGEWVSKEDTGTESNTEAEKGLASDSFKRACFNWGIGRELYSAPRIWVFPNGVKLDGKKTYDNFSVQEIAYDEQRKISKLIIRNDTQNKVVFRWENGKRQALPDDQPEQQETQKPAKVTVHPAGNAVCEVCKHEIQGVVKSSGQILTPQEVAKNTLETANKRMCIECFKSWQKVQAKAAG